MYNLISIFGMLFLTLALAVLPPQIYNRSNDYVDDYIYLNKLHFANVLQNCEVKLKDFTKLYEDRIDKINVHDDLLIYKLFIYEQILKGLEVLSDLNKRCIAKYRPLIPSSSATKQSIRNCTQGINDKFSTFLIKPQKTRDGLFSYYNNNYDREISNCRKKFSPFSMDFIHCVTSATSSTNIYAITNLKKFKSQMHFAKCLADKLMERAVDCSFDLQNRTISAISESNALINKCIVNEDVCQPCNPDHLCSNPIYVDDFSFTEKAIIMNPFYQQHHSKDCFIYIKRKDSISIGNTYG
ncbi:uncharacterized protein LOC119606983 [Lucilia sericata]|uniref:uncharacterized protein LOC119606983 n=1 Tax=Lucilia sericata TaxID=13632 RepID=UPI0018A83AEB|nr:uncharacterized protein LOC119606983 [Lucilia sericata]